MLQRLIRSYKMPISIYPRQNQSLRGFSLIETLVAVGLAGGVMLLIASLLLQIFANYQTLQTKINKDEAILMMGYQLKSHFSMAIGVFSQPAITERSFHNHPNYVNLGQVLEDFDAAVGFNPTTGPGVLELVGFFLRENAKKTGESLNERFLGTALYMQKPTVDRYGVLYLTSRKRSEGPAIAPSLSDLRATHLVDFKFTALGEVFNNPDPDFITSDGDLTGKRLVSSVIIRLVTREYLLSTGVGKRTWCPPIEMNRPQCRTNLPYRDTEHAFSISLRNNILGRSNSKRVADNLSGNWEVPEYRRFLDSVYFLRPSFPQAGGGF